MWYCVHVIGVCVFIGLYRTPECVYVLYGSVGISIVLYCTPDVGLCVIFWCGCVYCMVLYVICGCMCCDLNCMYVYVIEDKQRL